MAHVQAELARERQRSLLALSLAQREGRQEQMRIRLLRRAERAERRQLIRRAKAVRLRARLDALETIR